MRLIQGRRRLVQVFKTRLLGPSGMLKLGPGSLRTTVFAGCWRRHCSALSVIYFLVLLGLLALILATGAHWASIPLSPALGETLPLDYSSGWCLSRGSARTPGAWIREGQPSTGEANKLLFLHELHQIGWAYQSAPTRHGETTCGRPGPMADARGIRDGLRPAERTGPAAEGPPASPDGRTADEKGPPRAAGGCCSRNLTSRRMSTKENREMAAGNGRKRPRLRNQAG